MLIYRPRPKKGLRDQVQKLSETGIKSLIILAIPAPVGVAFASFWYFVLYTRGIYFGDDMREILTNALIPIFGVMYSLLTGVIISHVFEEYKVMRRAVKEKNIETFMVLKDEELSPLLHGMVAVLALAVLSGFMGLKYHNPEAGLFIIGGTSYIFSLLCLVVMQLDEPCYGFWVIKSIPTEWLETDAKQWRTEYYARARTTAPVPTQTTSAALQAPAARRKRRKRR